MSKKYIIISTIICLSCVLGESSAIVLPDNSNNNVMNASSSTDSSAPKKQNYFFYPGMDSPGNDIMARGDLIGNVLMLQFICNNAPNCAGFNTNGWLKFTIRPKTEWVVFSNAPKDGLYVKTP